MKDASFAITFNPWWFGRSVKNDTVHTIHSKYYHSVCLDFKSSCMYYIYVFIEHFCKKSNFNFIYNCSLIAARYYHTAIIIANCHMLA